MKIECNRDKLLEYVGLVEKISGKNTTLPVLVCILLDATGKQLSLRATNLEVGIEVNVSAVISKKGSVALPAHVLYNTLASVYDGTSITLELVNDNVQVTTKNSITLIKAHPHDDFPTLPVIKQPQKLYLKTAELLTGFRSVWYSASISSIKPELSSVYVYSEDKKLYFVATDSFRLAEKKIVVAETSDFEPTIIPFKNIADIIRVLERGGDEVEVHVSESQMSFVFPDMYLTTRTIDGNFPDYRQIIPKEKYAEAVVLKHDVAGAFKKANIFSDRFNQVELRVNPPKKQFTLSARNADVGETTETMNAALSGEEITMHFNHKYIMDCFQSIHTDSMSFTFSGRAQPLIIRGVGDASFLYLVMPMNK